MEPPRADVLEVRVHLGGRRVRSRRGRPPRRRPRSRRPRGAGRLLREGVLRLGQDPEEVGLGERVELDADREAPLQLGDQVRRARDVERAGRDEEDVVGPDHPVLRLDGRPLDERQEVALDPLARDVGAGPLSLAPRDLVDLVEEDDPASPRPAGSPPAGRSPRRSGRRPPGRRGAAAPRRPGAAAFFFFGPPKRPGHHPGEVDPHLLDPLRRHDGDLRRPVVRDLDLHLARLELPLAQLPAEPLPPLGRPAARPRGCGDEEVDELLLGRRGGPVARRARAAPPSRGGSPRRRGRGRSSRRPARRSRPR